MMKYPVDSQVCDACHKPFTLMEWVDRHEEDMGNELSPDIKVYHDNCCPSCDRFWNNWVELTDEIAENIEEQL